MHKKVIKAFSGFINTYKPHAVALNKSDAYEVLLKTGSETINVTQNMALIGLNKPTIAVKPLDEINTENDFSLDIIKNNILKANLKLKKLKVESFAEDNSIHFFEVTKADIEGRKFKKYADLLFLTLKNITDKKSKNLIIPPPSLITLFAYYIVPLPVYALCVGNMAEVDIFPDDIAGNICEDYYFFSVRTTNPSVKTISNKKNVTLCLIPFSKKLEMYSLGKHHKNGVIDLSKLNFKLILSNVLKIPIPEFAINAVELNILQNFEYGGYTVFFAQSVMQTKYSDELPLAHTPWYNL